MPRRLPGATAGRRPLVALATAALVAATPLRAQSLADSTAAPAPAAALATPDVPSATPTVTTAGPTLEGARAGATRAAQAADAAHAAIPVAGPRAGRPVALMIVGGAALVLGLIIGGNGGKAVAIGGAVVGLAGLYEFIR